MNKILLVTLLLIAANCYFYSSDVESTTVQYPANSYAVLQFDYARTNPYPFYEEPNWIWTNGTSRNATFQYLFYSSVADNYARVGIMANSTFYAYLNGVNLFSSSKFEAKQLYNVQVSCGLNNLTIRVLNTDTTAKTSGLNFYVNTGYEPNCGTNSFYNYTSCSCQCLGKFTCLNSQYLQAYPTCGCQCKNLGVVSCNQNGQYFDYGTCTCKCQRRYCRPGFQQDQATCGCRCFSVCTTGKWDYSKCKCI